MTRNRLLLLLVTLWSMTGFLVSPMAHAQVPLTRAVVEALRNRVRLMPQNRTARPASLRDIVNPGDGLATGQSSLAELRFNDGSLARVGEQVVFWFVPQTRTFRLSNGTMLLLVPPGRGRTHLQTPNVTAGIQGSALFVRYIEETDTTIVGALTDSGIEVFNQDGSQRQPLAAGQLAVVVNDQIEQLYDFDLKTFYETSDLVRDLNLDQIPAQGQAAADTAIAAVHAETTAALQAQSPLSATNVIENPGFLKRPSSGTETTDDQSDSSSNFSSNFSDADFTAPSDLLLQADELEIDSLDGAEALNPASDLSDFSDLSNGIDSVSPLENDMLDTQPLIEAGEIQDMPTEDSEGMQEPGSTPDNGSPGDDGAEGSNNGEFPGQGNGVTDENGNGQFPGQGNGVTDENGNGQFPGQGNGVSNGFPGGGNN